jgi:hypothetical protein
MHDRPTVHELLGALQRFLEEDVVPATDGRRQFLARVAANVTGMIDRELAHDDERLRAEWQRLAALVPGEPSPGGGDGPATQAELRDAIARATEVLCARIRAGDADDEGAFRRAVLDHVRATVRDKLLVANPRWL